MPAPRASPCATSNYKLIFDNATGWGLYDLRNDQAETQNLYGTPAASKAQQKLQGALNKVKRTATSGCFDKTTVAVTPARAPAARGED